MATIRIRKSSERWSDEDVSARLVIYSEDGIQQLLLKAVSNCKMYQRCSVKLADMGIFHSAHSCRDKIKKLKQDHKQIKDHNNKSGNGRKTSKWYDRLDALLGHRPSFSGTAKTIDSGTMGWEDEMAVELPKDDDELGNELFPIELEISELSPPEIHGSASSSPFSTTKHKGTYKHTVTTLALKEGYASN
ncbi:hypothetical protein OYC64_005866 [Pagothenia borchgrevinki]|uniref:Myb/SANT-like DNA-binding domain-containing protein n=1 Tax=Pagothenia borchgrevinki TaxID=8213 RepID=A0ABD2GI52_PAGBO